MKETATSTLHKGSSGPTVRALTRQLVALGFLERASNEFDAGVDRAVRAFQATQVDERDHPLRVDGIVGPLTAWRLAHIEQATGVRPDTPAADDIPRGGSVRGRAALRAALAEMAQGARETDGNNRGRFIDKYRNGLGAPRDPWCAAFVSWCYAQHADGPPFRYSLGALDIWNQFKRKGWALTLSKDVRPEPGDIVVWRRYAPTNPNAGHIGLVFALSPGGILYTVEGNKGPPPAPVRRLSYVFEDGLAGLLGFGRVPET
jgi:peptidoglycan hydrolase-like protein with peptidoglycan-binding domain